MTEKTNQELLEEIGEITGIEPSGSVPEYLTTKQLKELYNWIVERHIETGNLDKLKNNTN